MADLSDILFTQIPSNISELIANKLSIEDSCLSTKIDSNFVLVTSKFNFEKVSFRLNYIIPSITASYFFNAMMMDDSEPTNEIGDDTGDAIKEIISTINGNITTVSNGEGLDLGELKIETEQFEIFENSENYKTISQKFIKFSLKVNDIFYDIFLDIEDSAKEYFEKFFSYEVCKDEQEDTTNKEEVEQKENNQEEDNGENSNEKPDEIIEDKKDTSDDDKKEAKDKEEEKEKTKTDESNKDDLNNIKNKKIKLFIIIVASLLGLVLIGFGTMYFMGFFDKKEEVKEVKKYKNIRKNKLYNIEIKDKKIDFDISMINIDRLNQRLSLLTKYEILEDDILEKFKQEERQRLHNLKIAQLEKFANENKEEAIKNNKPKHFSIKDRLIYLKIEPLKYKKYKKIIDLKLPRGSSVSICQDKNKEVFVYIGPLLDKKNANILVKEVKQLDNKKETSLISLTKDDFNKLCDF